MPFGFEIFLILAISPPNKVWAMMDIDIKVEVKVVSQSPHHGNVGDRIESEGGILI